MKNKIALGLVSFLATTTLLLIFNGTSAYALQSQSDKYTAEEAGAVAHYYKQTLLLVLESEVNSLKQVLRMKRVGIGVELGMFSERAGGFPASVSIRNIFKNGPAAKAGVLVGDALVGVNGKEFKSQEEAMQLIRSDGKPGNEVLLRVFREGGWKNLRMTTAILGVPAHKKTEAKILEDELFNKGRELIQKVKMATPKILAKLESDRSLTDSDLAEIKSILEAFALWLDSQKKKVFDLIEALPE